jgi:divalent metal cation (Fe/Co/Zn/Cd) transporter
LFEDSAALIGIILATAFISLSLVSGDPRFDGAGSIAIGIVLAIVAVLLGRESKGLLIGERASPELNQIIADVARQQPGVCAVNEIITLHLAPDQVIATLSLDFDDELATPQIERAVDAIERRVRDLRSEVSRVFIRPQAAGAKALGGLEAVAV